MSLISLPLISDESIGSEALKWRDFECVGLIVTVNPRAFQQEVPTTGGQAAPPTQPPAAGPSTAPNTAAFFNVDISSCIGI